MKKIVLGIMLISVAFVSCENKQAMLTRSSINAKVDSLVGARMEEINRQAMDDLDHRIAIEVKAKADSIVQARTNPTANSVKKPM